MAIAAQSPADTIGHTVVLDPTLGIDIATPPCTKAPRTDVGGRPAYGRPHRALPGAAAVGADERSDGGGVGRARARAAGGPLGLIEAIRQLTDAALGSPVADARIGLVSGFGMINYDRGLASGAALLARAS